MVHILEVNKASFKNETRHNLYDKVVSIPSSTDFQEDFDHAVKSQLLSDMH